MSAALAAIERVESATLGTASDGSREFLTGARVAWSNPPRPSVDRHRLADRLLRDLPASGTPLRSHSRSALVRAGGHPHASRLRARAYLDAPEAQAPPLTLKVWSAGDRRRVGQRERRVRQAIAEVAAYPTPPILASGEIGGLDYLVEPVVYGRHPASAADRITAAAEIARALALAYQASGVEDRPLSGVVRPAFAHGLVVVVSEKAVVIAAGLGLGSRAVPVVAPARARHVQRTGVDGGNDASVHVAPTTPSASTPCCVCAWSGSPVSSAWASRRGAQPAHETNMRAR